MSLALTQFRFEEDHDGIGLLVWDRPQKTMNVFNDETLDELEAVIDHVVSTASIKGCVITSGKKDNFSGGADISMIDSVMALAHRGAGGPDAAAKQKILDDSSRMTRVYRRLETCGKPFAIALHGLCLGGAFELALACHFRVLSDDRKSKVGLPEIKIGIFPGAGGTQRVSRLTATNDALLMMAKGELLDAAKALKLGLVHALGPRDQIVAKAKAFLLENGNAVQPWDRPDFRLPSGPVYSKTGMMIWPAANAIIRKETYNNYPAARALLQSVYEGLQLPFDRALKVESRYFASILMTKEARAMIRSLFLNTQALNKGARRPAAIPPSSLKRIGLVGVGFMGAGIATVSAQAGLDVVMIDRDLAAAQKGHSIAASTMAKNVEKGRATEQEQSEFLKRLHPTDDYAALKDCDLVIEAVFEDPALKASTLAKISDVLAPSAVLASNTSTLPISDLARSVKDPARFLGIHFFSPVDRMKLVELIRGKHSSDHALAVAFDFTRLISKTPIVVNDARGFFANRCVLNYVLEGHLMVMEGIPPAFIENTARMAGMPVGPLALSDEVALDLIHRIMRATQAALGNEAVDPLQHQLITELVEGHSRYGRKNGKGFYDYEPGQPKKLWPGLLTLQTTHRDPDTLDVEETKFRFLATQALEAVRTLEQGIVSDPREADIGAILGFGFAPFTGGPLSMIDDLGASHFIERCDLLRARYGDRFKAPELLKDMAKTNATFYAQA